MKPVYIYAVCIVITIVLSVLFPNFHIGESAANTLYSITGIMFSIGLSLTVISNTAGVKNKDTKKNIRRDIKTTRNHFIVSFLLASVTFFMYLVIPPLNLPFCNRSCGILVIQGVFIAYFVYNFINIQRFNERIEDATAKD